ncbi:MAG TPA: hypothetical protein VFN10_20950 [Thermoanaerobaculia bacterium]|nr:hypothetical protein [Thermoanaerobaculia bacterium]
MNAFEEVWTASQPDLRKYCQSLLDGRGDLADDAVAMVALKAFSRPPRPAAGEMRAWFHAVARHVCSDLSREMLRNVTLSLDDPKVAMTLRASLLDGHDPERDLMARESTPRLRATTRPATRLRRAMAARLS